MVNATTYEEASDTTSKAITAQQAEAGKQEVSEQ